MTRGIEITMKITALEVASRYVYPSVRRRLVEILYKESKLTQVEVASILKLTQSAVSRYLQKNRGMFLEVEKFNSIDKEIKKLAWGIIEKKLNAYEIHSELTRITLLLLSKGYGCAFHHKIDEDIDIENCKTCIQLFKNIG